MTYRECYDMGRRALKKAGISEADLDARLLLERICNTNYNTLLVHGEKQIEPAQEIQYGEWIQKRAAHVPLQQLTGEQFFFGLRFEVNQDVLIPRQDTEKLVETALAHLKPGMRILDMCTGSGCIIISLLAAFLKEGEGSSAPALAAYGADLSERALRMAERNSRALLPQESRPFFFQGDLFAAVPAGMEFDMIVSNPPYIRTAEMETLMPEVRDYEPRMALDGSEDGLLFYRRILTEGSVFLKKGGMLLLEIGYDQGEALQQLLTEAGFDRIEILQDYAGLPRVAMGRKN